MTKIENIYKKKMPVKIESSLKALITKTYFEAVQGISKEEYDYILKKMKKKVARVSHASTTWISDLALWYNALFLGFKGFVKGDVYFSDKSIKFIAASIFYFINPFDIIPDHTPGVGYADDYLVFKLCLKSISKTDLKSLNKYFKDC